MVPPLRFERRELLLLREPTLPICPWGLNIFLYCYFMTYVYVLMVLVFADGQWRQWNTYHSLAACEEVKQVITHHRSNTLEARCEARKQQ